MKYQVRHKTTISYAAPVANAQYNLRLSPALCRGQDISDESLVLSPQPHSRIERSGPYCVRTTQVGFIEPIAKFELESRFSVTVTAQSLPHDSPTLAELRAFALSNRDISAIGPAPYLFASRIAVGASEIGDWAGQWLGEGVSIVDAAVALTSAIHREFRYVPGATNSETKPADVFRKRKGVCQDFAHVMIVALRAHGVPAAYVSGYLRTVPPPGKERLIGADAMHAWVKVWCGAEAGWIGFDPTNDCVAQDDHIQIGMGRDYADVAPIDGTFIGSAPQSMDSGVDVSPICA